MIIDIGTIKRKTNFVYTDGIGAMCDLKEQFSLYVFLVHAEKGKRASTHNQQSEYEKKKPQNFKIPPDNY